MPAGYEISEVGGSHAHASIPLLHALHIFLGCEPELRSENLSKFFHNLAYEGLGKKSFENKKKIK